MSDSNLDDEERKKLSEILNIYIQDYTELLHMSKEELLNRCEKEYGSDYTFLSEENLSKKLKDPKNHLVIYKNEKNEIIGFCYFVEINKEEIYLEEIHIRKEYRGRKLGSKLLKIVENFAIKKKYKKITLDSHVSAVNFYLKHGYKIDKPDYDPNYVVMSKNFEIKEKQVLKIKL